MQPEVDVEFLGEARSALLYEADTDNGIFSIYAAEVDRSIHFLAEKQGQEIIITIEKSAFSNIASSLSSEFDDPYLPENRISVISMFIQANVQRWVSQYDKLIGNL